MFFVCILVHYVPYSNEWSCLNVKSTNTQHKWALKFLSFEQNYNICAIVFVHQKSLFAGS